MLILGLIVIVILALVMSLVVIRPGPVNSTAPSSSPLAPPPAVRLSRHLQEQVRDIAARGNTDQAVKQLQKRADLSKPQATAIVFALQTGQVFPEPEPQSTAPEPPPAEAPIHRAPVDAELLTTLRRLVTQDRLRRTAAIRLLKDRTGMNARDARRFLDAL